ncbi:hypothetical protein LEAN103870_08780 [Legionella anisa]|nr:hypothetical protein [Legionella anisa]KTC70386.1 hypothetical protein Lani_1933 [Legionella anisa]MBN5937641.1 hypothetical protein [Legionella anisa]MCW8426671.1 hypothetical protein [Legionella anisa]MCW8448334.1 hypothetical protein [Legionella anisa]UAK78936.1 hypothetical protein K8O89_14970 [Legionella anisa]
MMSRLGMFFKPVIETTGYSIGAAAVGSSIYHAGTYINKKIKQHEQEQEQTRNDIDLPRENDNELHVPGLGIKIGF